MAIAAARLAETPDEQEAIGPCARCTASGMIGQCSRAGWRYLVLTKHTEEGGPMGYRAMGGPAPLPMATCMDAKSGAVVLDVPGMTCTDCPFTVASRVLFLGGIERVEVDFDAKRACVVVDPPGTVSDEQLIAAIRQSGYEASVVYAR